MKTLIRGVGILGLLVALGQVLPAQEKPAVAPADKSPRIALARMTGEDGMILRRDAGKKWHPVRKGEQVFTGDLLVGLPGATLDLLNGKYRITFRTDVTKKSLFPILESAIVLQQSPDLDLDLVLDRGRIDVTSLEDKLAKFTFHWQGKKNCTFETLKKDSVVLLETYSRWAPGVVFDPKNPHGQKPLSELVFLVVQGEVMALTPDAEVALKAPPGPALFITNNVLGGDKAPRFLEKLPDWLTVDESNPELIAARKRLGEFRQLIAEKGPEEAMETFLASDDLRKKRLAIVAMCAVDDLERLRKTFLNARSPEVLDLCIHTLRHWLGRDAEHCMRMYRSMTEEGKIPQTLATTVLQLLHSFSEKELAEVETYEALVGYLRHHTLGIRALAYYHLIRAYPEGKAFAYNPAGTDEERAAAVMKWRAVLESGKLPPKAN